MGNFSQSGLIGKPLKQMYIKTKFNAVISAAGLNSIRFHDLRHPYVKPTTKIFLITRTQNNTDLF